MIAVGRLLVKMRSSVRLTSAEARASTEVPTSNARVSPGADERRGDRCHPRLGLGVLAPAPFEDRLLRVEDLAPPDLGRDGAAMSAREQTTGFQRLEIAPDGHAGNAEELGRIADRDEALRGR